MKIGDIVFYFITCGFYWWYSNNSFLGNFSPDFIFIVVISVNIISNPIKGMFLSFLFGVFMDIYSSVNFGLYSLLYTITSYAIYHLKFKIDMNSSFSRITICFIGNFLFILIYDLFYFFTFKKINIFTFSILQPLWTVIFFEPIFNFIYKLKRKNNFCL